MHAIIASPTGTALIPTQGSCLPFVETVVEEPSLEIDFLSLKIEDVGLTANLVTISWPEVIPPKTPPALLDVNDILPLSN